MSTTSTGELPVGPVLVVDDEHVMRTTLELVLAADGWLVDVAASGRQALDRLNEEAFDLVVLDHWMPGLTGLEVVARLRAMRIDIPVVIFSACLDPDLKEAGEQAGVTVIDKLNWHELVRICRVVDEARHGVAPSVAVA